MTIDVAELRELSRAEKLRLVNLLWEDLHSSAAPQLPPEEWEEIFRREKELEEHPERALTLEQMWARVSELRQKQ